MKPFVLALSAAYLALTVAACGGGGAQSAGPVSTGAVGSVNRPTVEEHIAQVDGICRAANSKFDTAVAGLSPYDAAWSKAAVRFSDEALAQLRALPPPEADRARFNEIYALLEPPIDVLRQVPAAASVGDAARVSMLVGKRRVELTHQMDRLLGQHGALGYRLQSCPLELPR